MYKSVDQIIRAMRSGSPSIKSVTMNINRYYKARDFEKALMFYEAKIRYKAELEDDR